jgi:hypothetical protein
MMNFPTFAWTSLVAIFGTMIAFLGVTKIADEVFGASPAAEKFRKAAASFDLKPSFSKAYVHATYLSDAIYGPKLLSVRAILVSTGVSVGWFALLSASAYMLLGSGVWFLNPVFRSAVLHQFWYFFLVGVAIDFASVCLTRQILLFAVDRTAPVKAVALIVDVVACALLFYLLFEGAKYVFYPGTFRFSQQHLLSTFSSWFDNSFNLQLLNKFLHDATIIPLGNGEFRILNGETEVIYAFPEGMAFFASMLTSFWIVVHIGAYLLLRTATQASAAFQGLLAHSAVKTRPFMSVGTIACLLVLIPMWLIGVVAWLFVHSSPLYR